jgi:hypothetical protein
MKVCMLVCVYVWVGGQTYELLWNRQMLTYSVS